MLNQDRLEAAKTEIDSHIYREWERERSKGSKSIIAASKKRKSDALPKMSTFSLRDRRTPITRMKLLKSGCKNKNKEKLRKQLYGIMLWCRLMLCAHSPTHTMHTEFEDLSMLHVCKVALKNKRTWGILQSLAVSFMQLQSPLCPKQRFPVS